MADIAFHGVPAIKAQALERLQRHIAAGTFVYFPAWENGQANAIGSVVEADDTSSYAEILGYPVALAETLPVLVNGFRRRDEAAAFAEAWLARTPVGAELSHIVSQLVVSLLDDAGLAAITNRHPALQRCRQTIMDLHRQAIRGDAPDRKAWKSARLAAVAVTDGIGEAPLDRQAGCVVEAAAWPGTMRTVLRDTLTARGTLDMRRALAEINWGEAEENRVFHIRQQAEESGYKAEFNGIDRVLAILDDDHPELASGFRERNRRMEESSATYRSVGWQIIALMEGAPLAVTGSRPAGAGA